MDKTTLFARFRAHLDQTLSDLDRETLAARSGTRVDGDNRGDNRGERAAITNQGYLTHGLEQRRAEVKAHLDLLQRIPPTRRDRVVTGALVHTEDEHGQQAIYLLLPGGQGHRLGDVTVLSPESPIARALHGLSEGDSATATLAGTDTEIEILQIS